MVAVLRGILVAVWLLPSTAHSARAEPLADIWRGLAAYNAQDYEKALVQFDAAFTARTLSYQHRMLVSYNRGLTRYRLADYAGAIDDFNRTLKLNARHHLAFAGRGAAFAAMGEYYRALQDYDRALKFEPNFALAYYYRAKVQGRLGNQANAAMDFENALSIDPNLQAAQLGLEQLDSMTQQ